MSAPGRPGAAEAIFGGVADASAAARPSYPDELFDWITETCRRRERACGGVTRGKKVLRSVE